MTELRSLSDRLLRNYVRRYEAGRVQQRPRLRVVDGDGRACLVGAMAGVDSSRELAAIGLFRSFRAGPLSRISRLFEEGRVSSGQVYDACLLELARRSGRDGAGHAREDAAGWGAVAV